MKIVAGSAPGKDEIEMLKGKDQVCYTFYFYRKVDHNEVVHDGSKSEERLLMDF